MSIVANLIRAMKPKMLDSFKDHHAQKEFLSKVTNNKNTLVILRNNENRNVISNIHNNEINLLNVIKVYQFQFKKK